MNPTPETPEKASIAPKAALIAVKGPTPKKEAKKSVAKKPAAKKTVSKKTSKDGVNKSEEIRKVAKDLQAKGEKVRPVTIVEILKRRGITIAPPQASMVLKKMGFKRRKHRKSGAAAGGTVVKKASQSTLSVEDLLKAKRMADEFGGAERLVNAISALVELQ